MFAGSTIPHRLSIGQRDPFYFMLQILLAYLDRFSNHGGRNGKSGMVQESNG